jgi:hypothetical protein
VPNQGKVVALHSNDVVFLAWQYQEAIPGCLGFSVRRKDVNKAGSDFQPLPAWVGWQGGSNADWKAQTTDIWPVQKFNWRDFTAQPGSCYQYQVVPMTGDQNSLKPATDLTLTTEEVHLTPDTANNVLAYFNNGILSTQSVAHFLPPGSTGAPSSPALMSHINKPGDPLRNRLAGQMIEAVTTLLKRAQTQGGECYMALYELDDEELIQAIIATDKKVHLILSYSTTNGDGKTPVAGAPPNSRQRMHAAGIDIHDRMLPVADIGHNKSIVYLDPQGKPAAVLCGSTNWTQTGLCAQSNNSVIIEDPAIAAFYFDYWNRLKDDTVAAGSDPKALQAAGFRSANNHANVSANTTVWYSPNTKGKSKPAGAVMPPDLSAGANQPANAPGDMFEVFRAIHAAKQAVIFLEFMPGTPSVLDVIKAAEQANPNLFIRGAATDPKAIQTFNAVAPVTTELYSHGTSNPDVVFETGAAATAVNDQFAYWNKELLKSSQGAHAIIHDKIVVIDPLSDTDCIVVMGSHNHGYKASYANDENLVIFRGNGPLARAYATHVMDVYDHYRWRFKIQTEKVHAWTGLQTTPDWQKGYFDTTSQAYRELCFWVGTTPPPLAIPPAAPATPASPAAPATAPAKKGGGAAKPTKPTTPKKGVKAPPTKPTKKAPRKAGKKAAKKAPKKAAPKKAAKKTPARKPAKKAAKKTVKKAANKAAPKKAAKKAAKKTAARKPAKKAAKKR